MVIKECPKPEQGKWQWQDSAEFSEPGAAAWFARVHGVDPWVGGWI